jgi:hypothetical protein
MGDGTVAGPLAYLDTYYNAVFRYGMGTEPIIDALRRIPPVDDWLDLGAGSESLFWSIPLSARTLLAVDVDRRRLDLLEQIAARPEPRGAYRTVLEMCGRTPADFAARRASLTTLRADCLSGEPLQLAQAPSDGFDVVTQFGLLGLTTGPDRFRSCWTRAHARLKPGGWCAGANWIAAPGHHGTGRVTLTHDLYTDAMHATGITPQILTRVPIHGDAAFTALWLYLGRKT